MFGLPDIHLKPHAAALLDILDLVALKPPSWDYVHKLAADPSERQEDVAPKGQLSAGLLSRRVDLHGLARYLTTIVASDLRWIEDEETKETIWRLASARLSERSGRSAMAKMLRTFTIPTRNGPVDLVLHEPALTGDSLGLKTWAASYLLAKRLSTISRPTNTDNIVELGAGTGLAGMAAACIWGATVRLSDLCSIVPNLAENIAMNESTISRMGGTAVSEIIEWEDTSRPSEYEGRCSVILLADTIYSEDHPDLVVGAIDRWLLRDKDSLVLVEVPLRSTYRREITKFRREMLKIGLEIVDEDEEIGYDDWESADGDLEEVKCWWAMYHWAERA